MSENEASTPMGPENKKNETHSSSMVRVLDCHVKHCFPDSNSVIPVQAVTNFRLKSDEVEATNREAQVDPSAERVEQAEEESPTVQEAESNTTQSSAQFLVDDNASLGSFQQLAVPLQDLDSTNDIFCRICHEMDQDEQLISPCKCKGSMSLVHRSCLQHWLAESDSSHCELCGFKYMTRRVPKYSLLKSVVIWLSQNRRQRREVLLDLLAAVTFVPMAGMGTYIGIIMAESLQLNEEVPELGQALGSFSGRIATLSIISLMTTLDVAYATWAALRLQHHLTCWYSWYRRNSEVTLHPMSLGLVE